MELFSWSLRQRGYCDRIPDAAPSHALSGVHTPIVVTRESGLTIIELELELVRRWRVATGDVGDSDAAVRQVLGALWTVIACSEPDLPSSQLISQHAESATVRSRTCAFR